MGLYFLRSFFTPFVSFFRQFFFFRLFFSFCFIIRNLATLPRRFVRARSVKYISRLEWLLHPSIPIRCWQISSSLIGPTRKPFKSYNTSGIQLLPYLLLYPTSNEQLLFYLSFMEAFDYNQYFHMIKRLFSKQSKLIAPTYDIPSNFITIFP